MNKLAVASLVKHHFYRTLEGAEIPLSTVSVEAVYDRMEDLVVTSEVDFLTFSPSNPGSPLLQGWEG